MRATLILLLACGAPELASEARTRVEERHAGAPCDCRTVGEVWKELRCETNRGVVALWRQGYPESCYPNPDYPCCLWYEL